VSRNIHNGRIEWPDGKAFAFSIFDDPDFDTVENVEAIYSFLWELGLRTTKAVWPVRGHGLPRIGGATCADKQYLASILKLQQQGFEIALHNVTHHTSTREETARGIDAFHGLFGHYPHSMANHSGCQESIYWESARVSGLQRLIYNVLNRKLNGRNYGSQGHIEASPLFWGDICKDKIRYVRNFVFGDINTLKACPAMPYHDAARPYVNTWFAASEGATVDAFNMTLHERNQDRLASQQGASIMYTHFAKGFVENGKVNERFKALLKRMVALNGWFVPVRTLLDFIAQVRGRHVITVGERNELERKWLWHKIVHARGRT
jgi:hypothetical protein